MAQELGWPDRAADSLPARFPNYLTARRALVRHHAVGKPPINNEYELPDQYLTTLRGSRNGNPDRYVSIIKMIFNC